MNDHPSCCIQTSPPSSASAAAEGSSRTFSPETVAGPPPSSGALVQDDHRQKIDRRLARIEGQVRGVRKMVEDRRWCLDVLTQVEAIQESLRGVSSALLSAHLRHCVADAAKAGDDAALEARLAEVDLLLKRRRD